MATVHEFELSVSEISSTTLVLVFEPALLHCCASVCLRLYSARSLSNFAGHCMYVLLIQTSACNLEVLVPKAGAVDAGIPEASRLHH